MTPKQRNALHEWCERVADEMNASGMTKTKVLAAFKAGVKLPWSKMAVKEDIFKTIMAAITDKESSEDLTPEEVSEVIEIINNEFFVERLKWQRIEFPRMEQ